jgi:zinc protease
MNLGLVDSALTLSDGKKGAWTRKENGETTSGVVTNGGTDRMFRDFWEQHDVDLILTSGHATQVNLELSFGLGAVVCANGDLYTLNPTAFHNWVRRVSEGAADGGFWFARPECEKLRQDWAATTSVPKLKPSSHPKVFFGVGNCLIGDTLKSKDSMVTAWLGAGGVSQFVAYTIPTWYGKGGWGTLDLWQGLAGQMSLAEAVYLNNQRILYRLQQENPKFLELTCLDENINGRKNRPLAQEIAKSPEKMQRDQFGMMYDRDALVLYGDPLWDVRLDARNQNPIGWKWNEAPDHTVTLTITAQKDYKAEALPLLLPHRVKNAHVVQGEELKPVANDEFVLLPNVNFQKDKTYVLKLAPGAAQTAAK